MSKIKVFHISDWHGQLLQDVPNDIDLVINTGDFLPNQYRTDWVMDRVAQRSWLYQNGPAIKQWLNNKKMLFVSGNHDRTSVEIEEILSRFQINIVDITNKLYIDSQTKLSFYGFPYIPWCGGDWCYELHLPQMDQEFKIMKRKIADVGTKQLDCLLAHCPPYGVFDLNIQKEHIGNQVLSDQMSYGNFEPRYIFCGHVHENAGSKQMNSTFISQAACTSNIIEIEYEPSIP